MLTLELVKCGYALRRYTPDGGGQGAARAVAVVDQPSSSPDLVSDTLDRARSACLDATKPRH